MDDVEAIRRGIERCLRRFSLEELRIHGGVVLGTASVRAAEGRLVSSGRRITTTTLAAAMAAGIRQPTMDQFEFLRLLVSGYCGNTTWQVHLCSEPLDFDESASMESVACALGEGLSLRCRVIRGPHGAMLAALGPGARAAVMLYFPELRCVLAGWTVDKTKLLSNVANALGFEVIKDCHLSGRHVPSLLRLLESRKGASVLADAVPAEQRPQRTRYGLDFASASHDGPAIVERFAGDAPVLQCLSVTAETSQPDYGMCVKTTAVLSSPDVAASLMDMGKSGLIAPDSVFFTMIERGRNKVTIKFRE